MFTSMLFAANLSGSSFSDNFEDGVIDTSLWVVGGDKRSYLNQPAGDWQCSHEEIIDPDGYLQSRVWGPASGNTYGHDVWVRSTYNFNDGQSYCINFTWEPFTDGWVDFHYIQITDGYTPQNANYNWARENPPVGTTDLLWYGPYGIGSINCWPTEKVQELEGLGITKMSMSISITPDGMARLYEDSDLTGNLLHEGSLNPSVEWYLRFMLCDATSSGFGAGDSSFNLYDFSATVIPGLGHVQAGVDIDPDTLNLKNKGRWITCYIELPQGYDVADIDVSTIKLNDSVSAELKPTSIGDYDNDGIPDLMVKFDMSAVQKILQPGDNGITVTGELNDGTPFEDFDTIRVINPGK